MRELEQSSEFIGFAPPLIEEVEVAAVGAALRSGWLSTGPRVKEFEEKFSETVGATAALALNSCTAGLHLALKAHGVGPGDEVITSTMTFCATANVIEHTGARTVLADVVPGTLLIDPLDVARKLTPKTKAIIPVHYAGQACEMASLEDLATSESIDLIEDAAHCLPTLDGTQMVGSKSHFTAFSFYATKNITTGEGGMLTGAKDLVDRARVLSLHGMSRDAWKRFQKGGSWKYDVAEPGYKYNMTDIQAALGLAQLSKLESMYLKRKQLAGLYKAAFCDSDVVRPLAERPNATHSWHLFVVELNLEALTISRDEMLAELSQKNIGASVHYIPVHMLSYYAQKYGYRPNHFPFAFQAFERMISLPLSPAHKETEIEKVIETLQFLVKKFRK